MTKETSRTTETLSVLDALGLDSEDIDWRDFVICAGQNIRMFYEGYESSLRTAKLTDEMCLSCPVRKQCLQAGVENGEYGVWGGVYLTAGRADDAKNDHKTDEVWEKIREGLEG